VTVLVVNRGDESLVIRCVDVADLGRCRGHAEVAGRSSNASHRTLRPARPWRSRERRAATTTPARTPQTSSDAALARRLRSRVRIQFTASGYGTRRQAAHPVAGGLEPPRVVDQLPLRAVGQEPDHTFGPVRSLEKTHDPWRVVYAPRSRLGIGEMPDGMPVIVRP
jgi:hypothetical protein